jgi:peroxiredoxin
MKDVNERTDDITIESEAMEQEVRTKLELGHTIPEFRLRTVSGEVIGPADYKQKKNLVLFFYDVRESESWEILAALKQRYHEFKEANTEVLAISPGPVEELKDCVDSMRLPFPVLCDCDKEAVCAYCVSEPTIFVADKFGELEMHSVVTSENADSVIDAAVSAVELSELECPECGVSTWPKY